MMCSRRLLGGETELLSCGRRGCMAEGLLCFRGRDLIFHKVRNNAEAAKKSSIKISAVQT